MKGFHNCLFSFFSEISGNNSELFTTIHSLFSFCEGWAILSVGPAGTALLKLSPHVNIQDYAIGKYKVRRKKRDLKFGRYTLIIHSTLWHMLAE